LQGEGVFPINNANNSDGDQRIQASALNHANYSVITTTEKLNHPHEQNHQYHSTTTSMANATPSFNKNAQPIVIKSGAFSVLERTSLP